MLALSLAVLELRGSVLLLQDDVDDVLDTLRSMRHWSPDIGTLVSSTNAWLSTVEEPVARSEAPVSPARRFSIPRAPLKPLRILKPKRQSSHVLDAVGQSIPFAENENCSP